MQGGTSSMAPSQCASSVQAHNPTHAPSRQVSSLVHGSSSAQSGPVSESAPQPVAGSQTSSVQSLPSSQASCDHVVCELAGEHTWQALTPRFGSPSQ